MVNTDRSTNLPGYNGTMNGFIADCGHRLAGISLFNAALEHEKDHIENFGVKGLGMILKGFWIWNLAGTKEREQLRKDLEIMRKRSVCK